MPKILNVSSVNDYTAYIGGEVLHPLVGIVNFAEISPMRHTLNNYGVYGLFLQDGIDIDLDYGCGRYDYDDGTLICVAPGQIGGKEDNGETIDISGWALLFHPDLLHGTQLEKKIREYSFFDYRINEALHMSDEEHELYVALMRRIQNELRSRRDSVQDSIIVSYIELVLNYCHRFYSRQFLTRKPENNDVLIRFDDVLRRYFDENRQLSDGLPTVQYCADRLCMSPKYFGDLVKKSTGETAGYHIRRHLVGLIKNRLASGESVSEAAYSLGFDYPQHLSRMFKKHTGISPSEYFRSIRK